MSNIKFVNSTIQLNNVSKLDILNNTFNGSLILIDEGYGNCLVNNTISNSIIKMNNTLSDLLSDNMFNIDSKSDALIINNSQNISVLNNNFTGIGDKLILPCSFKSQKDYVNEIIKKEVNKRLAPNGEYYSNYEEIPEDWASYKVQEKAAEISAPSENCINLIEYYHDRDIVSADDELKNEEVKLLKKGLQKKSVAHNTVCPDKLEKMIKKHESRKEEKEKLIN